jgi:hypothetical protein
VVFIFESFLKNSMYNGFEAERTRTSKAFERDCESLPIGRDSGDGEEGRVKAYLEENGRNLLRG